jgi:predicted DNA binding protein
MTASTDVLRLQMDVWHPDCWTLEATEEVSAGLLAGMHPGTVCRATVYGDTITEVEALIDEARTSSDLYSVFELNHSYRSEPINALPGNTTKELLVEKRRSANQISESFHSHGFICAEPINMYDGTEQWTVLTSLDRERIQPTLDDIREQESAEIEVTQMICATDAAGPGSLSIGQLSVRQQEVFDLARKRGYYAWPKETTPQELADELGITTSTFHEHLHKAEEKLLNLL